jgi:hypothetical protein
MWGVSLSAEEPFVYSIFGVQYFDETPDQSRGNLIQRFDDLIRGAAQYIDQVIQDGASIVGEGKTHIWLAYWGSVTDYKAWSTRKDVAQFWGSLPPDAGMWREILTIPSRRTQYGTNKTALSGLGHLGPAVSIADKTGYWGCYRHRIAEASTDKLQSPIESYPTVLRLPSRKIRHGRIHMTNFPDNICFVVEGQDHSAITAEEKGHWFEHFDDSVTQWMNDLVSAGPEGGILDSRLCYAAHSGQFRDSVPVALNYNRKIQLFYFSDLRSMERIGRQNKGHAALRSNFMESYGPGGPMADSGEICLWVETSILKSNEIECEYIGCVEGTGFLAYSSYEPFAPTYQAQ